MVDERDARAARAAARAGWFVRRFVLGQEPTDDLAGLTPGERVEFVWQLTLDAWASLGAAIPSYSRAETPGKVIRRHDR